MRRPSQMQVCRVRATDDPRRRAPRKRACAAALALALVAPAIVAAQQPQATFGARVTRVRVDAIVTDAEGRFVLDLRPEDFELREDGRPQEILGVQLVDLTAGTVTRMIGLAGAEVDVGAGAAPAAEVSAAPDDLGALIFVVDGPSLDLRGKRRFANAWIDLLAETDDLGVPRAAYMIDAVGNLQQLSELTFDVDELTAAANVVLETPTFGSSIYTRLRRLQQDMNASVDGGAAFDVQNLVRANEQDELVRSLNTFDLLAQFCGALASRPGRTAVVWVSTGVKLMEGGPFAVLASRDAFEQLVPDRRILTAQRELHEAANSANVSIYSIDPSLRSDRDQFGLNVETVTPGEAAQLRSYDMQASLDALRDSLRNAAEETGGEAFVHSADVASVLTRIDNDSARYYLLTYAAPRDDGDGEFHRIDVRVRREGTRVRARAGYVDWPAAERRSRALSAALAFPGTVSGLPIRARAVRRFGNDGEPVVQILAAVERPRADNGTDPSPAPSLSGIAGVGAGTLDFYTVVVRGGDVVEEVRTTLQALPPVPGADPAAAEQFIYVHDLELDSGSYEVRLAAQGMGDDELGATRLEVEVAAPAGPWTASDLLLLGGDGVARIRPLVEDRIEAGEVLTVYVEVAGGRQPHLTGSVSRADETTFLATVPIAPLQAGGTGIDRGTLRLRGLGPGSYVVDVEIVDEPAGESASFRVPVEVTDSNILSVAAENLFGPAAGRRRSGADITQLLARLDRLAALYESGDLRFTARETIIETNHTYTLEDGRQRHMGNMRRISEFDYGHPSDSGDAGGRRQHVGVAGGRASPAEELAGFELAEALGGAFAWPALFRRGDGPPAYRFEPAGEDVALGRRALLVAFRPNDTPVAGARQWFGTAWIDAETFQFLRVHALERADYDEKVRFAAALSEADAAAGDFFFTEITTEYWEEANGLRLPGQVTINRNRYEVTGDAARPYEVLPHVEVTQSYIDYEFTAIPSAEEIRLLVLGTAR